MEKFRKYKPQASQLPMRERKKYDVFLSFRGPDVRKTFADHLYKSLFTAGLNVFIDSEKLEKGENIGMSLQQAIQNSTIYIPIFSPDYASSPWCLREVSLMWQIKSTLAYTVVLIPLFYYVEPSHVRYPYGGGPYTEAFDKHRRQGRHSPEEIQVWKDALYEVSCLSGWSLKETSFGYEGKLVKQVVKDVLQTLDIGVLDVAKRPVGLTSRCEEAIKLLKLGDGETRLTLGIWGMGGLGKTTLSKALYNKIHHLFEASSFLSAVKLEESQGLRKLQQQILRDLLKTQVKVNDIDHGKVLMRNHLASLRALVVLDDVDNVKQLDALMGDWFGEGSRIIITTRDKRVLEIRQIDVIYPMRELELAEGVELFSWHAFLRVRPEKGYGHMTERIVMACSGLPLSLEIIGTDLYDRNNIIYWIEALHNLENVGHTSVFEILKTSYDTLNPVEKHIFLDIACFFVHLKSSLFIQNRAFSMEFYSRFWSTLGWTPVHTSLKILEEKALIVIHKYKYIEAINEDTDGDDHYLCEFFMHEQVRDMGRRIVQEESWNGPAKRSRVWLEEDIRTLMAATSTTVQENSNVEGFVWRRHMEFQHIDSLASLQKLDFLLWYKLHVKAEIRKLPTNLKYLVLSKCQLKEYHPQMTETSSGIDINEYPVQYPFLSPVLPKSIAQLKHLRYLDMSGTKQTCLPNEVCELDYLEELYLSGCSLEALPEAFGNLIKLKTLDVSNNSLSEFPSSFECLTSLVNLEMAWNEQLENFPALPEGLISLNARRCSKLQAICFRKKMNLLKTLDLSHCRSLARLRLLLRWKSLRDLRLDGCKQLVELDPFPEFVTSLNISGCSQLQKISSNRQEFTPSDPVIYREESAFHCFDDSGSSSYRFSHDSPPLYPEMEQLGMIGCDNIQLNIYQLLKDFPDLKQLDLSLSPESVGEPQLLTGQKDFTLQSGNLGVIILFCFILETNENVRLPQMDVFATLLSDGGDLSLSQTFKVPSRMTEDDSGKFIMRVCVWNGTSSFKGGRMRCFYSLQAPFSQCESPVLLRQVEILLLKGDSASVTDTILLKKWNLLSPVEDFQDGVISTSSTHEDEKMVVNGRWY